MHPLIPALILIGPFVLAGGAVFWGIEVKRRRRARALKHVEGLRTSIGAEDLGGDRFRWNGRIFRLSVGVNPIFSRSLDLRLSTFCDSVLEFEVRAARNVPVPLPEALRAEPLFRGCALDAPSAEEPVAYLLGGKDILARTFPERWSAFSKMHCELVLSANRFRPEDWDTDAFRTDLGTLDALARIPSWRRPKGGTWTWREGFEPRLEPWHWKPEQRARLPEGTHRWCVSLWYDNAYLNAAIVRFLTRLAGSGAGLWATHLEELRCLEEGWGRPVAVRGHLVALDPPEMAVAADQYYDGEFFGAFLACDEADRPAVEARFARAGRHQFFDAAIDLLPRLRFFARRLYDDEFSWFSGEYEIVSARLGEEEVREALDAVAAEFGAAVREIDRPFSFKLLKDDRLDVSL